jgi:hypothetical protein
MVKFNVLWLLLLLLLLHCKSRDSSVGILTVYGLWDDARDSIPGSREGHEIFLFSTESKLAPKPTQPPLQSVLGALTPRVKRPGSEAYHSPVSIAEIKNNEATVPRPHMSSWYRA